MFGPVAVAVAEGAGGNYATRLLDGILGNGIAISSPRPDGALRAISEGGGQKCYEVMGSLKKLPKDHVIWLLVEDPASGKVWPQLREAVTYDQTTKAWRGQITAAPGTIRIHAVVAPPSSQDFFRYYKQHGPTTGWSPLTRIPPECRNRALVQARGE